jgi:hypothetical protein
MAAIVFSGKAVPLDEVCIHRDLGGATISYKQITTSMALPKSQAIFPHLYIALNAFQDIAWRVPTFSTLCFVKRYTLASAVFSLIVTRKTIAWFARKFGIG